VCPLWNVSLAGLTHFPNDGQCSLGVVDGEPYSPAGQNFIPIDPQHHGNVVETAGVLPGPPLGD
jgi:hypothetical protein